MLLTTFTMVNLKDLKQTTTLPEAPKLEKGMKFANILGIEIFANRYQTIHIKTDKGLFRSSAKPIREFLVQYFMTDKKTEPIQNVEVVEKRSKDGRMYLALEGF